MAKQIIFFQGGGGQEAYEADMKLVASLKMNLGTGYSVHYPLLENDETPDLGRRRQIGDEIAAISGSVTLVGHSLGASMLLAYLSETAIGKDIQGIFLIATPFWRGTENWVEAFKLQPDFADRLSRKIPLFFYHCLDDKEVPFDHLSLYKKHLPWAKFREIPAGGHQLNNDLGMVVADIRSL